MARPSFEEALEIAKQYYETLPEPLAEYYLAAPADIQPKVLAWLIRPRKMASLFGYSRHQSSNWEAVNLIAQRLIRNGEPLPRELADWVADRLEGKRERPKLRRKGRPHEDPDRDDAIIAALRDLRDRKFEPMTRNLSKGENPSATGGSACDAVGVAFDIVQYKRVDNVWQMRRRWEKKRKIPEWVWGWLGIPRPSKSD